jgi:alpha-D-xyloside xylohydrolase
MRPLFVDFPDDPVCEVIEDQFMFGSEIMVAPVVHEGAREREVYLPAGVEWINAWDRTVHPGGQRINVPAPLETIPVFLKANSRLIGIFHTASDQD